MRATPLLLWYRDWHLGRSVWADAAGWRRRRAVDYMVSIQYLKQMERMTVRSTPSIVFGSVAVAQEEPD